MTSERGRLARIVKLAAILQASAKSGRTARAPTWFASAMEFYASRRSTGVRR